MLVNKVILTNTTLENDGKEVYYTNELLEKLSNKKNKINIELDKHGGKVIGEAKNISYNDGKLYALMDIPDEYVIPDIDVGFSTDIVPTSYEGKGTNVKLVDGYLDNIVFLSNLNDTNKPNDKNTITRLLNSESGTMSNNEDLSRLYGQLQEENRSLKEEIDNLKGTNDVLSKKVEKFTKDYSNLKEKYNEGKELYNKGKEEYEKTLKIANEFKSMQEAKKSDLLEKLVPKDDKGNQDEFKLKMYNKLEINELESLINDKKDMPSTPPNGASGDGMGNNPNNHEDGGMDYLEIKRSFNL